MDGNNGNTQFLSKPDHIVSLATSCVLVNVDVRVWTATMQDSEISDEVTAAKKADRDSGKFVKHLLAKNNEHKRVLNYRQTVYNWMQRRTYDWAGSQRILPVVELPRFMAEMNQHKAEFTRLVDDFIKAYPTIVSNMAFVQGDMFKREDYPTINEVFKKFSIDIYTAEVPTGDFRCRIANDLATDLQVHYERQARGLVDDILNKQKAQLIEVMQSLSHCCETETVVGENGEIKVKRRKLYDTTLQRAVELCNTFAEFNLTRDSSLEEARTNLLRILDGVTIDQLRESDTKRVVVKEGVDDILSKFGL
jgi:hypothetical protein